MKKFGNVILVLVIILLIATVGFGGWYFFKTGKESNEKIGNLENQVAEINKKNSDKNEEPPVYQIVTDDTKDKMTIEDKAMLMNYCPDFSRAEDFTSESLIEIIYAGINRNFIPELKSAGHIKKDDTSCECEYYTEADIKKAIKDIFGVTLKETATCTGLEYFDGKYIFMGAEGDPIPVRVDMKKTEGDNTITYDCVLYTEDSRCEISKDGEFTMTIDKETGHIISKISK